MSACLTLDRDVRVTHLSRDFAFVLGGAPLDRGHVAYECVGPAGAPVVLVLGGISAGRKVTGPDGFWTDLVGPGKAIDTRRVRVLGVDYLAGCGQSSGARDAFGRRLPAVTPHDQARAILEVCRDLGVERLHAVVGASYGGQCALALAALACGSEEPHGHETKRTGRASAGCLSIDHLVVLCAAHESHPLATAQRATQRSIVRFGQRSGDVDAALRLARGLAMTTYRSAEEFAERFRAQPRLAADGDGDIRWQFEVEGYLDACGAKFVRAFDADAFLALSESLDLHRIDPAEVRVNTTLIGFDTDTLVPTVQLEELAGRLASQSVERHEVRTRYGHDGFLKEVDAVGSILRRAIGDVSRELVARPLPSELSGRVPNQATVAGGIAR